MATICVVIIFGVGFLLWYLVSICLLSLAKHRISRASYLDPDLNEKYTRLRSKYFNIGQILILTMGALAIFISFAGTIGLISSGIFVNFCYYQYETYTNRGFLVDVLPANRDL